MEPSLNSWTILFLIAAVQGIFLSILLFGRRSRTNSLLAWLTLSFSLCLGYYVIFWTGYYWTLPWQIGAAQGLTFVFGPLTYFYIRSDRKSSFVSFKHFAPFILYAAYFVVDAPPRVVPGFILACFQIIHLSIYSAMIFYWLSKNRGFSNGALKRYHWQRKIAFAFLGYTFSFFLFYLLVWTGLLKIEYDYMISFASSFFIYFIGYHGFQRQEVLRMNENAKYDRSALSSSASMAIVEKLRVMMESEKPYLNSSLKLQEVSDQLGFQPHHISQVINEVEEKNFSDFINEYRVSEAIKLLKTTDRKVIHVAYDSGFNNKASFNNAFKKVTGMSPSQYREIYSTLISR